MSWRFEQHSEEDSKHGSRGLAMLRLEEEIAESVIAHIF